MEEQKSEQDVKHLILAIGFNETTGKYEMNIPQGSNVPECAFGVAALIKCLVRDGVIEKPEVFLDYINKYTFDEQYQELEGDENEKEEIRNTDESNN